ncbi:MAG: hypothetical protein KDN19_05230 [Verrucomicrobiae bacterium]|nr:hypothetical protein [Verrucomicrobiae bacterium]
MQKISTSQTLPHLLLYLLCLSFFTGVALSEEEKEDQRPIFQELLGYLHELDEVLPPVPDMAPVHTLYNPEAVVPPQCYTRTEAKANPCYVCHQDQIPERENRMNDRDLQVAYSFSDAGTLNHWKNLFEDRSARVAAIPDEEIRRYIAEDNYSELAGRLREKNFQGYVPDLANLQLGAAAFDEEGFAKDGSHWVAFNYKPFPSTFWPTNGSTDDVMIRLPEIYRTDKDGRDSREIYKTNLAILEAAIKGVDSIGSLPLDETAIGKDVDGDGKLGITHSIFKNTGWVGAAEGYFLDSHLYPGGTEFLHTVRYVGLNEDGTVGVSTRMKEVRYMWKVKAYSKPVYGRQYDLEAMEKEAGNLPGYVSVQQHGLDNGNGWAISGFIEDRKGRLRFLTHEENFACMGCHNTIGSTIDKTFSFARKIDGAEGWGYIDLHGMLDAPSKGETVGEIELYLTRAEGGSEFRNNDEMAARWFKADGTIDPKKIARARDVYDLIVPSTERALTLNKAYRTIVEDQDFIYGKDAIVTPPANVYDKIDNQTSPTLPEERTYDYDIILDWSAVSGHEPSKPEKTVTTSSD